MSDSIATMLAAVAFPRPPRPPARPPEPPPAPAPAPAQQPAPPPQPLTPQPPPTAVVETPAPKPPVPNFVKAKWGITLSGYFQADSIYDSTQSFNDAAVGTAIARPGSYAARNDRVNFGIRSSRGSLRLTAAEFWGIRRSAFVEFDFLGNNTPPLNETQLFSNPTMRARHVYLKLDSEYLSLLVGQTWHVFGWQPFYFPNTTSLQGVPGEPFTRSMQIQVAHTFASSPFNVDVAF